jgi:SnoaL-like domain
MERSDVSRWVDAYRDAWISNDPVDVGALFTEEAVYASEPFVEPWRGRDEIVRRWTAGIKQQVALTYEVLAIDADLALVHWHVFTRNLGDVVQTEYDGVLAVSFADDGRCREVREWFARRERP